MSQTFRTKSGRCLLFNYSRQINLTRESELNAPTIFAENLMTEEYFSLNSIFLPSVHFHGNIDIKALHSCNGLFVVKARSKYYTIDCQKFINCYFCHTLRQSSYCKHSYSVILYIKITVQIIYFGVFRYIRCETVQLLLLQGVGEGKRL
jgi:hypothetical protein